MEIMSETTDATHGAPEGEDAPKPAELDAPDTGTEHTEPAELDEPEPKPKQTPWFQKRIDEVTRNVHEARREADFYKEQLRQIQQGQPQNPQTGPIPTGMVAAQDVERLVEQRFTAQQFNESCNAVFDAGVAKHADFQGAVDNFRMLGGTPQPFLEAVAALGKDDGARVYYELGKNPEEAQRVLSLPPVRMALELARMASSAPKTPPVSKVPAPISPIGSGSRAETDVNEMTTAQYRAHWLKSRSAR